MTAGGQSDPASLDRATRRLEVLAQQLTRVAQDTQRYHHELAPLADGLDRLVGGSATGRDRQIAAFLHQSAAEIKRSADASLHAARSARRAAAAAQQQARDARRRQAT